MSKARLHQSTRLSIMHLAIVLAIAGLPTEKVHAQSDDQMIFVSTYPNGAQGFVSSVKVEIDGSLTLVDTVATSDTGCQAVSLSPDGRYLAVSHGTAKSTENVDVYAVANDGTLTHVVTQGVHDSPLDLVWLTDQEIAISQTDFGASNVRVWRFDPDGASLSEIDQEFVGGFFSDLALDPLGRTLHANDSTGNKITTFAIDDEGELDLVGSTGTSGIYPLGMEVSQFGDFLYAGGGISSNRDKVIGFSCDVAGANLSPITGMPFVSPGNSPKQALPTLGDRVVFVAHGTDATIRSFMMNETDGSLTYAGHTFDVGFQGSLGKLAAMGNYLFVPDNSTAIDGKSGVDVFSINADGSFTVVGTDLFDVGLSTPNSVATWDPRNRGAYLRITNLIAGESATLAVTSPADNAPTAVMYSLKGTGRTFIKPAQITIQLQQPKQLGNTRRTNANGEVSWTIPIPDNARDTNVWFQAIQFQRAGNIINQLVR